MTDSEKLLWEQLRKNKLGIRFKPQHPINLFIVDFYSYALKLIIEIDGPIHEFQKEHDKEREAELIAFGNKVIRFTNEEIFNDMPRVLTKIREEISRIQSE